MPITLNCPKCHKPFRVRDESVGLRVRCPSCGAVLQVPSNLAPASVLGSEIPPTNPGDLPRTSDAPTTRPMAEPIPPSMPGDSLLDSPPRRIDTFGSSDADLGMPPVSPSLPTPPPARPRVPGTPEPVAFNRGMPSAPPPPPSFVHGGGARPQPLQPQVPAPTFGNAMPQHSQPQPPTNPPRPSPVKLPNEDVEGWARVRRGFGMTQVGLFFFLIPFLAAFGHLAWYLTDPVRAADSKPGFIGLKGLVFWQEVALAYTAIPAILGGFCLLMGRMSCSSGVPANANADSLAIGLSWLSIMAFVSVLVAVGAYVCEEFNLAALPKMLLPLGTIAAVSFVILSEVWCLLFAGHIGIVNGHPQVQKKIGTMVFTVVFLIAAVCVLQQFRPLPTWTETLANIKAIDPKNLAANRYEQILMLPGIILAIVAAFFLRYIGVLGAAKRSIVQ